LWTGSVDNDGVGEEVAEDIALVGEGTFGGVFGGAREAERGGDRSSPIACGSGRSEGIPVALVGGLWDTFSKEVIGGNSFSIATSETTEGSDVIRLRFSTPRRG